MKIKGYKKTEKQVKEFKANISRKDREIKKLERKINRLRRNANFAQKHGVDLDLSAILSEIKECEENISRLKGEILAENKNIELSETMGMAYEKLKMESINGLSNEQYNVKKTILDLLSDKAKKEAEERIGVEEQEYNKNAEERKKVVEGSKDTVGTVEFNPNRSNSEPKPEPKPGTNQGQKPEPKPGTNQGQNPGPNQGQNPGPNQGQNQGQNQGPNQGPNQGRNQGPNQGRNQGPNQGPKPGPNPGPNQGRKPGPKPGPNQGPKPEANPEPKPEAELTPVESIDPKIEFLKSVDFSKLKIDGINSYEDLLVMIDNITDISDIYELLEKLGLKDNEKEELELEEPEIEESSNITQEEFDAIVEEQKLTYEEVAFAYKSLENANIEIKEQNKDQDNEIN